MFLIIIRQSNTANPFCRTIAVEMNGTIIQWTTTVLLIDNLNLNQCHISTVCLKAIWILNCGKLDMIRLPYRFNGISTTLFAIFIGHSYNLSSFILYIRKCEKIFITTYSFTL